MKRPDISYEHDALIDAEARKRAACLSNKEIAEITGKSLRYIANRIAYRRHRVKIKYDSDKSESDSD